MPRVKKKNKKQTENKVKPEVREKLSSQNNPEKLGNLAILDKLFERRGGGSFVQNPDISRVRANSSRISVSKVATQSREFYYSDGKFVKEGLSYHIYYTTNLEKYYMTGSTFTKSSKLIFPTSDASDFTVYNALKPKKSLVVEQVSNIAPTEKDYKKGVKTRYFAKKITDVNSKIMEISKEDMDRSPLYRYVSLTWLLTGDKTQVFLANRRSIENAAKVMPSIGKFLPTFQFYRKPKSNLKTKKDIMQRLGIQETNVSIPKIENIKILGSDDTIGQGLIEQFGTKKKRGSKKGTSKKKKPPTTTTTTGTQTAPPEGAMTGGALGIMEAQEETTTTTTNNTNTSTQTQTGPPPGVMSGGAGGAY